MGRSGRNIKKSLSSSDTLSRTNQTTPIGADPIWWDNFIQENPVMIHVTHLGAIDSIKKQGVIPSPSNWEDGNHALSSRPGYTYFTLPKNLNDVAAYYQDPVYLSGDEFIDEEEWRELNPEYNQLFVVLIKTSDLKPERIAADEDCLNHIFESSEAYPRDPDEIDPEFEIDGWDEMSVDEQDRAFEELLDNMQPLGEWAEEFMSERLSNPETIKKRAEKTGNLAYKGGVNSDSISEVLTLEEATKRFKNQS